MKTEEAKKLLEDKGYTAFVENGVVIAMTKLGEIDKTHAAVKRILKEAGYKSSFGVRVVSV